MYKNQLSILNPNIFHGCHPLDLRSYLSGSIFHEHAGKEFPIAQQSKTPLPPKSARQCSLERIVDKLSLSDFPDKDYAIEFIRHKYRRNCKSNTLRSTLMALKQFLSFYRDLGKKALSQITREDIEAFIEFQQDRSLSPVSVQTHLNAIYAYIRFLVEMKVVGHGILERKIRLRLPSPLPKAIDPEDLNQLLSVIDRVRGQAMILLLLRTGMRIGELLNTKVTDIDLREKKVFIYQAEKTEVGRVVYYSVDAREALMAWLRARDPFKEYLFYGQGDRPLCYEAARTIFRKYLRKAKLEHSGYTLHCLRHTYATDLLNARIPIECLSVLLGHTNLEVTRRYARLTDKTREDEYFTAMDRILKGDTDEFD